MPSCSINPVLSCGSVMITPQASVFGFPNPLIGIVGFTVVVVTGVLAVAESSPAALVLGRAWLIGTLLGVVFVHWLIFQSLYRHRRAVPVLHGGVGGDHPAVRGGGVDRAAPAGRQPGGPGALQWRWSIVALWFTAVILMILVRFWNYWSTLI